MSGGENVAQFKRRIRAKLTETTKNRDSRGAFICTKDAENVWRSIDDVEKVLSSVQGWTRDELEDIQTNYVLTLSILFLINWLEYHDFRNVFYDYDNNNRRRNDHALHYEYNELSFLGDYQDNFYERQYLFKPAVIKGSDNQPVDRRIRLPFTEESQALGSGGFGYVNKVKIAPGHFETGDGSAYLNERDFAIKRFPPTHQSEAEWKREVTNVQLLKESLSKHDGVMLHVATIIHGNEFAILMPIAERWDLDIFLYYGFNRDAGTKKAEAVYEFETMFPKFVGHSRYESVLSEMYTLADALDWLHNRLNVKSKPGLRCAHTDFKPSNILISSDHNESSYPAGRWVITDFGISAFRADDSEPNEQNSHGEQCISVDLDLSKEQEVKTVGDFMRTQTLRVARTQEGTYQAPEACQPGRKHFVGRRSDIWSFGCVLLEVITFALGSVELLDNFRNERWHGHNMDYFYAERKLDTNHLQPDTQNLHIELEPKKEVQVWMAHLSETFPYHCSWIEACTNLVKSTLAMQPLGRPDAALLKRRMEDIWKTAKRLSQRAPSGVTQLGRVTPGQDHSLPLSPKRVLTFPPSEARGNGTPEGRETQTPNMREPLSHDRHQTDSNSLSQLRSEKSASEVSLLISTSLEEDPQTYSSSEVSALSGSLGENGAVHRCSTVENVDSKLSVETYSSKSFLSGDPIRQCALHKRRKILSFAIAPDGKRAAYLYPQQILVFLVADGSLYRTLDLHQGVYWRQISISGYIVAVYGIRDRRKQVFLHDLMAHKDIEPPGDFQLNDIWRVIASPQRSFGFVSKSFVGIFEIGSTEVISFAVDEGYTIWNANFSADGTKLCVWATGPDRSTSNRCYFWSITYPLSARPSFPSRGAYRTRGTSMQTFSLLTPTSDQFCVMKEDDSNRFIVVEVDCSGSLLPQQYHAVEIQDVLAAGLFGSRSLICVHRPKRNGFSRENPQVREYRFATNPDGSRRIRLECSEFAPLETDQVDETTEVAVLPGEQACVLCSSNGKITIVKRKGSDAES